VGIDADGRLVDIRVVKSLGMGLDEKAVQAVQKWRFRPGMKGGEPVATQAEVELNFRLL
jgi:TonB family protein